MQVPGGQPEAKLGALQGKDTQKDTTQQLLLSGVPLGWAPWFPSCAFSSSWEPNSEPRTPAQTACSSRRVTFVTGASPGFAGPLLFRKEDSRLSAGDAL